MVYGDAYGVSLFREGEWTVAQVRLRCMTLEEYEAGAGSRIQEVT